MKKIICFLVILFSFVFLTGCNENENDNIPNDNPSSEKIPNNNLPDDDNKEEAEFQIITTVSNGYSLSGDTYTFTKPGEYKVRGILNGTLFFAANIADSVLLYLDGVTITAKNNHAIYWASENGKIEIKTTEGSVNTIKAVANGSKVYSAIESENNIEIGGSGTLNIIGSQRHAVKGSNITIKGNSKIDIKAIKDGLHGKHILFTGSETTIHECTDAIQAEVNSSNLKGTIVVEGGTLTINNCKRAFRADVSVTINKVNSDITIKVNNADVLYETPSFNYKSGTLLVNGKAYK